MRHFDPPAQRWLPGHRGVDLRTSQGAPVRAAGDGRVAFAGTLAGRGVITIDHGDLRTTYEPVDALVAVGERVHAGETIGTVGTGTGHCGSGRCLHLGLRRGREYLDPMLLLGPRVSAPAPLVRPAGTQSSSMVPMRVRMPIMALECSWQIRLSVTPSTRPISARVRPS